ncbi:cytochrome c family protein, partial [Mesorhizobium sp. M00.F.Ca.ET.158.01.1.1]
MLRAVLSASLLLLATPLAARAGGDPILGKHVFNR